MKNKSTEFFVAVCIFAITLSAGLIYRAQKVSASPTLQSTKKEVKVKVTNWKEVPYQLSELELDDQKLNEERDIKGDYKPLRASLDDGEEWVKKLKFKFTNTSDKDIIYLAITLTLPTIADPKNVVSPIIYMHISSVKSANFPDVPVIRPGESISVRMQEKYYESFKEFCESNGVPNWRNIEEASIEIDEMEFSDNTGN